MSYRIARAWSGVMVTVVCAAVLMLAGCGKSEGQPIAFKAELREPLKEGEKQILTVTEFTGPSGFEQGTAQAGVFVVKGTYDLTGSKFDHGYINFSIDGSYELDVPESVKNLPMEEMVVAMQPHMVIPQGSMTGTFEIRFAIKAIKQKGGGQPWVSFSGNQKPGGDSSTAHQTLMLK